MPSSGSRHESRARTCHRPQTADVAHRDIKPANVMVGGDGRVKVLDFGLADSRTGGSQRATTGTLPVTAEGRIVGTVGYMSPEQAQGGSIDYRSDIFSFGIVLYEMATGRRAVDVGESNVAILSSIVKDSPRLVSEVNPKLPHEITASFGAASRRTLR